MSAVHKKDDDEFDFTFDELFEEKKEMRESYPAIHETQRTFFNVVKDGVSIFLKVTFGYAAIFSWAVLMGIAGFLSFYFITPALNTCRWAMEVAFLPAIRILLKPFALVLETICGSFGACLSRIFIRRQEVPVADEV